MTPEQRVDPAANRIEADRLAKNTMGAPFQPTQGERVLGGICDDQDLGAGKLRRDLGHGGLAMMPQDVNSKQKQARHQLRGL